MYPKTQGNTHEYDRAPELAAAEAIDLDGDRARVAGVVHRHLDVGSVPPFTQVRLDHRGELVDASLCALHGSIATLPPPSSAQRVRPHAAGAHL
jgi:hypothetical protein